MYAGLVIFCTAFVAVIFLNSKTKQNFPELKPRQGALANAPEWAETQKTYKQLAGQLETNPQDARSALMLAKTFMNEGRATGDFSYYNRSALELIDKVLLKDPKNFEAVCLESMVYLSQHRFAEGKTFAEQALQMNPYNSFVYGLLVDANVEQGDYKQAVEMCDKMVSIRPDMRSYSRISYLRELHGDVPGALDAIQQAIAAGVPGQEDTEWARMVQAHLFEDSNMPEKANEIYQLALEERPDYPHALAGLGRIAVFNKHYGEAIQYFEKAVSVMNDAGMYAELAEAYRLNGQTEKGEHTLQVVIDALNADNLAINADKKAGHNADLELANLYLKAGQPQKALTFAQAEYKRRPDNMDACETLAWALFQTGRVSEAAALIPVMMRTNSQKPERMVKAGVITAVNGDKDNGKKLISKGLSLKPYMDVNLANLAQTTLKS